MKKVVLIVLPILVLGGTFVGLAVAGVLKVPGLTPKKAKAAKPPVAAKVETPPKTEAVVVKPVIKKEPVAPVAAAPQTDAQKGAKKLAQLWNNLPALKLADVAKEYKDRELAEVLIAMDPEKVAELLGALDAKRSARLSKELQKIASVVPKPAG